MSSRLDQFPASLIEIALADNQHGTQRQAFDNILKLNKYYFCKSVTFRPNGDAIVLLELLPKLMRQKEESL